MLNKYTKKVIVYTLCDKHTLQKAIKIAFVVGSMLNIINQGEHFIHLNFDQISYAKLVLTYFVPFFVSTYTAININMRLKIGDKSLIDGTLTCKKCKQSLHINHGTIIPTCQKCGMSGDWEVTKIKDK